MGKVTDKRLGGLVDTIVELYATEKITQLEYRSVMFDLICSEFIDLNGSLIEKIIDKSKGD